MEIVAAGREKGTLGSRSPRRRGRCLVGSGRSLGSGRSRRSEGLGLMKGMQDARFARGSMGFGLCVRGVSW
jgi:hypothetical protein